MTRPMLVTAAVFALALAASGGRIPGLQSSDPIDAGAAPNPYLGHPVIVGPTNPYLKEPGSRIKAANPYLRHPVIVGPTNPDVQAPGAGTANRGS
jgi:hypothetical protein